MRQLQAENKELKEKLDVLRTVEDVLSATASEVEEIIKNESDPRVLGVLVASLKRELKHSNTKKGMLMEAMKLTQSDHRRELDSRKKLEEKCANLESENYRLEQELKKFAENSSFSPTSTLPLKDLTTNETPSRRKIAFKDESIVKKSSDSPYLQLTASNVGLSPLLNRRKLEKSVKNENESLSERFTIFKKPRLMIQNTTQKSNLRTDVAFDGLGGSSKPEIGFRTQLTTTATTSSHTLKRIPSAKFKKLTKNPSVGRIDSFFGAKDPTSS